MPDDPKAKAESEPRRRRRRDPEVAPESPKMESVPKAMYDQLQAELDATKQALSEEMERAETAEVRVKELEPFEAKYNAAESGRRSLEAARAYDQIADELGVKPEFKDAVLKLMDFKPGDGEFDAKALRDHASKWLDGNKQFTVAGAEAAVKRLPRDPFAGKGGDAPADGDGGKVQVSRKDFASKSWRDANQKLVENPGSFELVD